MPWPTWPWFVHRYREGLRLRASEQPESRLLVWPAAVTDGAVAEGGQGQAWRVPVPERGHLGSSALPPHSSPLSQACLAVGAPPPPPLVLEWGRLRPHPMEDVAKTVHTHAHKCVNGLGSGDSLPHSSLSPGSGKPQSGGFMDLLSCMHSHLAGPCTSLCSAART